MSQCSKSTPSGMCNQPSVDGSTFCKKHSNEHDRIRSYRLSDPSLRERFEHHADSESLRTVREEVILLRTMIDDRLNMARNEAERMAAFQTVSAAIGTLAKLVETLQKLEKSVDLVLGKDALQKLGSDIVSILIEELSNVDGYAEIVDRVAARIGDSIANARNKE